MKILKTSELSKVITEAHMAEVHASVDFLYKTTFLAGKHLLLFNKGSDKALIMQVLKDFIGKGAEINNAVSKIREELEFLCTVEGIVKNSSFIPEVIDPKKEKANALNSLPPGKDQNTYLAGKLLHECIAAPLTKMAAWTGAHTTNMKDRVTYATTRWNAILFEETMKEIVENIKLFMEDNQ